MLLLLVAILLGTAVGLFLMMVVQAMRGTEELLSVRNFFLLGFILFQLVSPSLSLWTDNYDVLRVSDQPRAAIIYTVLALAFLAVFLFVYKRRSAARWIVGKLGAGTWHAGPSSLLTLAVVTVVLGILAKVVLVYIPYLGIIADALGSALLIVAVGMAAWVAAPRLWNPAVMVPAVIIVLVAGLATLSRGAFSRRDVVALIVSMAWGAYHGHWKHRGLRATFLQGSVVLFCGLMLFGAFTVTRSSDEASMSPGALVSRLTSASPFGGLYELGTGQFAGANSMWIIQTRPDSIPYDTLHTARYVLAHPIPRALWPGKPGALGENLVKQGHIRRVSKGTTLGPGLIGHIYNDNPWLAFLPYTVVLALCAGFLDQLVRSRPWDAFSVLPIAVALGEIVGMPRGELGLFFVRAAVYLFGSWLFLNFMVAVLRTIGLVPRTSEDAADPLYDDDPAAAPDPG